MSTKDELELVDKHETSSSIDEEVAVKSSCGCKIHHSPKTYTTIPDIIQTDNSWLNLFVNQRPNLWGILFIVIYQYIVYTIFMTAQLKNNYWYLMYSKTEDGIYYFYIAITMVVGAFIAGSTPEGSGAVAYPVMTILMGLGSNVGRDFSMMIQSFGMTSASVTILYSKIKIDPDVIVSSTLGGLLVIPWLQYVAPNIPGDYSKIFFVSYYLTFICVLFYLNFHHRKVLYEGTYCDNWRKRIIFFFCGAIGSIITAIAGTGIDTFTYQVMLLGFGLHEKVGNPTCVIIMAINVVVGWFAQVFIWGTLSPLAFRFVIVGLPMCVIFAPLGAYANSMVNRYLVLGIVFVLDIVQYILVIVYNPRWQIGVTSVATFVGVFILVAVIARIGIWNAEIYSATYKPKVEWDELNPITKFICWKVLPVFFLVVPQILLFCTPVLIDIDG